MPASAPVRRALGAVAGAPTIVGALRLADALAGAAAASPSPAADADLLGTAVHDADPVLAIAAVHALARVFDDEADRRLTDALHHEWPWVAEHAAWALGGRVPSRPALARLADLVAGGGFPGMIAQRTTAAWARAHPEAVVAELDVRLRGEPGPTRAALVETLALVDHPAVVTTLTQVAEDGGESAEARVAAVAGLGTRPEAPVGLLESLAADDGLLGMHAALALHDLAGAAGPSRWPLSAVGLRVAQLYLHAELGSGPDRSGAGDNGGIAALLRLLSDELARRPEVAQVLTVARGSAGDALDALLAPPAGRAGFAHVAYGTEQRLPLRDAWSQRVAVERGLHRLLRSLGPFDALHLRMADVGTLAAANVARRLGIPVVFTLAPDPHSVIARTEASGELRREDFGRHDHTEHVWFRARLVERMAKQAERLVLLPRPGLHDELRDLLGIDVASLAGRAVDVPEGVSRRTVSQARQQVTGLQAGAPEPDVVARLRAAVAGLPPHRHGLPLLVSAGRLHPVKGMARVAAAWAGTPELHERFNLLVVGGDLDAPSAEEREVLHGIRSAVGDRPGLLLLGHQPHTDTAELLSVAATGLPGPVGRGGVYVAGSVKEEFGLAILEALAAGLVVVAPQVGGPATYVADGCTGVLTDTTSVPALAAAVERASALVDLPGRVQQAQDLVLSTYTIEAMVDRLVRVYRAAAVELVA